MIPTTWAVMLSAALLAVGVMGIMLNRSALRILISIELVLNAANINFVAFAQHWGQSDGLSYTLFSIALAAAEAAVGLAILIHLYRHMQTVDADAATTLRW